jgi:hypothetical protein
MSRKKLLDYLTELIVEGPFNWALSDMKDPKTGLPIMPPGKGDLKTLYSKDLTSGDYLTSTKTVVGKAPVGSSSAYNTTCSASLFEQKKTEP